MKDEDYDREENKKYLLSFVKDMAEAWEDFLTNKDAVCAFLMGIRDNDTKEAYEAIVKEAGFQVEEAEAMIAEYQEEESNG
jgi:predicted phosphoadenosine phosphosulfate sulfurtransferase